MITTTQEAYAQSLSLLREARGPQGFLASPTDTSNYQRVWARDGVITGLAALLSDDQDLIASFRRTLQTLAANQAEGGQIPSNVLYADKETEVSFGGLSGRVDTLPWFIIGVCNFVHLQNDLRFLDEMMPHLRKCLSLMEAWEFNNRGLMYVPQSGDWADEYILHGYVLYDQLLRLWALRCLTDLTEDHKLRLKAEYLEEIIRVNYWPDAMHLGSKLVYHEGAYKRLLDKKPRLHFWQAGFFPGGYFDRLDAWANALAVLLQLGSHDQQHQVLGYLDQVSTKLPLQLVPQFYPPVQKFEKGWDEMLENNKYQFRNHPYEFHNGGSWPVINAFVGMALVAKEESQHALRLLASLHEANRQAGAEGREWSFYENFHTQTGKPLGTPRCTWSAAGGVLLQQYTEGRRLWFGS